MSARNFAVGSAARGWPGGRARAILAAFLAVMSVAVLGRLAAAGGGDSQIGFDDLAPGALVTTQYADLGLTFNGPQVIDTSDAKWAARSSTNAIELPMVKEFHCQPTLELDFAEPIARVAIWYGLQLQMVDGGSVALELFGSDGSPVGSVSSIRHPGEGPEPVDTLLAADAKLPAYRAVITTTEGMNPCALVFDDLEFEPVAPPPPDLSLEGVTATFGADGLTVAATVRNSGGSASGPTSLAARAQGWSDGVVEVPAIEPGGSADLTLVLPDAGSDPGSTFVLDVAVDGSKAGDTDASNDETEITLTAPTLPATANPTETPPPSIGPTGRPAPPPPNPVDVTSLGWVALVVGAGIVALVGAGSMINRLPRPPKTSVTAEGSDVTLSVEEDGTTVTATISDGQVELKAEDREPPKECNGGSFFCRRSVAFDPRRRSITAVVVHRGQQAHGDDANLDDRLIRGLTASLRRARRLDTRAATLAFQELARELTAAAAATLSEPAAAALTVEAVVEGSSAEATFTLYRCEAEHSDAPGFKELGKRPISIKDHFRADLAVVQAYDGRERAQSTLTATLAIGLEKLAERL